MTLRTELLLYILCLALLNVLLAFGAIALFARMGPAIGRILEENVVSIDAAEQLLAEFAAFSGGLPEEARLRVMAALDRATANVTEPEEPPILDAIRLHLGSAMKGDEEAKRRAVDAIRALIAINRRAMAAADAEAGRLGAAGAWAAVFTGALTFAISLLIIAQFRRRVLEPLLELYRVLDAARGGDRFRRCRISDAPLEVQRASRALNSLLDERLGHPARTR